MPLRPIAEAIERASVTVEVAQVFLDNAPAIARACAEAAPKEVVVAVARADRHFDGINLGPLGSLYRTVMGLAPGG